MERKLKAQAMGSVGELPAGYLHLPTTPIKQEPELTDWISGDLKPTIEGVYEVESSCRDIGDVKPWYSFWSGRYWGSVSYTKEVALERGFYPSRINIQKWRGLSSNPNEVQS